MTDMVYSRTFLLMSTLFFIFILNIESKERPQNMDIDAISSSYIVQKNLSQEKKDTLPPWKDVTWRKLHGGLDWESISTETEIVMKPIFNDELKSLEGQEIELRGHIQNRENYMVITAFPIKNKDSELEFEEIFEIANSLQLDGFKAIKNKNEIIKVRGVLKLNNVDFDNNALILTNVIEIK